MEHQAPDWADPDGQDLPGETAEEFAGPGAGVASPAAAEPEPDRAVVAVPATGEPRVDAALKLLERLPGLPVADHAELFEQVHAQLSEVLGKLESGSSGPASG